jgi:hypothetical protein
MQLLRLLIPVFILFPCFCFGQSETTDVESIAASLITKIRQSDKDRIFLQTDKKLYVPGETIWFKAFIVDSINDRITYKNKILYVDLVNDKDSVINVLLMRGDGASINSSFVLNDSSMQGYYWLRAYTKKMIDENINNIGLQQVYVINNKIKSVADADDINKTSSTSGTKLLVDIYPEGGYLISGTNSLVALKVHDENGNPIIAPGVVKDNHDTVVAKFNTNSYGLAKFTFSPTWYGKYKIYILNKDRYDSVGILPRVNPYAAQLSVEEQNEQSVKVRVMLEDSLYSADYTTYILAISKDSLCFAGIGRGMYELNIPVSNFPGGIAKLVLFNSKKELISERNIYLNKKNVTVNIDADRQNYSARENAKLDVSVTDGTGKPLPATLSVLVLDTRITDTSNNFYNEKLNSLSNDDADLVMLTQKPGIQVGIKPGDKTEGASKDTLLIVKGTVVNKKKEPVSDHEVMLMSNSQNAFILQDTTDEAGKFSFVMPDYDDGSQFNLQVSDLKGVKEDDDIILDPLYFPRFTTPVSLKEKFFKDNFIATKIEDHSIDSVILNGFGKEWLKPVTVSNTESDKKKKNTLSANVITQEMLQRSGFNNLGMAVLQTGKFHLVSGYMMEGGPNGFAPSESDEPKIFMDGQEVSVASDNIEKSPVLTFLKTVPTEQVDYVKVLSGNEAGIYGVRGGHGVIEIHSSSKATNYASTNGLKIIYPQGFHVSAPFAMPDYTNKEIKNSKTPDLRTTIYWNGDVMTDKDGKVSVNFFTADPPSTYVVGVTGITANGDKIYKTITITRK